MKRLFVFLLALALLSAVSNAWAESARDYAAWLEEALPGAAFTDGQVPEFVLENLGADYEFIARTDPRYGSYIAGVRRESASKLPADVHESAFSGTFETTIFRAEDSAGKVWYEFVLTDGMNINVYDGMRRVLIDADPTGNPDAVFQAADAQGRARLLYRSKNGFSAEGETRAQLCFPLHNIESWKSGATKQPHSFYLNVDVPKNVIGSRYMGQQDLIKFTRIPIGLYLRDGEERYELVISETDAKGVITDDPLRLYEAGTGFDRLLDMAEKALGYRPGEIDFQNRHAVGAQLEWLAGELHFESGETTACTQWNAGRTELSDPEALGRLDALMNSADFSVGSVNCPSDLFLTIDYDDGGSESFAVATNSYELFFHNGMYFTVEDNSLLDIFNFRETEFYRGQMGG